MNTVELQQETHQQILQLQNKLSEAIRPIFQNQLKSTLDHPHQQI